MFEMKFLSGETAVGQTVATTMLGFDLNLVANMIGNVRSLGRHHTLLLGQGMAAFSQ